MNSIIQDFNKYIDKISLNKDKRNDIDSKYEEMKKILFEKSNNNYNISEILLSGSYGKGTEINEYSHDEKPDVDIIVIIDNDKMDSEVIINDFFKYLKEEKGTIVSNIRIQSNSIRLLYTNINVDIVIAYRKKEDNDILMIASTKNKGWIESNTVKHIKYIKDMVKKYERFDYRDLMKIFKYINKNIVKFPLKSFTLEQMVHQCCPSPTVDLTICMALEETLTNISKLDCIVSIRDCVSSEKKGYDEKDVEFFTQFRSEIEKMSMLATAALEGKRKNWELILGELFPKQDNERVINSCEYDKKQTPWNY